jgi:YVTN family beta-propeller protein
VSALAIGIAGPAGAQTSFVEFESGQVRPLALSPDGTRLFAVNTPDNRLEVFGVSGGVLTHLDSIPVGMEPVAVAARSNTQVWVVNHLSDSVSIVDLASTPARVVRTLVVGDEPRDIVFAGTGGSRAFISTGIGQQRSDPSIATTINWATRATTLSRGVDIWFHGFLLPAGSRRRSIFAPPIPARRDESERRPFRRGAFHRATRPRPSRRRSSQRFQVAGGSGGAGAPGGVVGPRRPAPPPRSASSSC